MFIYKLFQLLKKINSGISGKKKIMNFIWAGKKPRIRMKILMDDKERGGLQLLNLKIYNEAICLFWIKEWITLSNKN